MTIYGGQGRRSAPPSNLGWNIALALLFIGAILRLVSIFVR